MRATGPSPRKKLVRIDVLTIVKVDVSLPARSQSNLWHAELHTVIRVHLEKSVDTAFGPTLSCQRRGLTSVRYTNAQDLTKSVRELLKTLGINNVFSHTRPNDW